MKRTFLFSFLLISLSANAQLLGSIDINPKTFPASVSSDPILIQAIDGSAAIIKQSYQVKHKKNGKVFGRDGRKEFGCSYSIGVKSGAGLILTDIALKPWLDDNAFKKVEDSYEPLISLTEIREIRNGKKTKFAQCPLQLGREQPIGMWIAKAGDVATNAMEIDIEEGKKDGWLIWFAVKGDLEKDPSAIVSLQAINKSIEVNGGDIDIDAPVDEKAVLGGIYVCPFYLGGGHVAYRLVGMMVKEDKQWKLRTPFIGYTYEKTATSQTSSREEVNVGDEVKEEQQEEENVELTPIAEDKQKKKKNKK